MITIVDYGLGNIQAFCNIYERLGIPVRVGSTCDVLTQASQLILPGVGAFDWAMSRLNDSGLRECLDMMVLEQRIPVLGICVGMQMMANGSEEGMLPGLGWIDGDVKHFDPSVQQMGRQKHNPLPHMGWNSVTPMNDVALFKALPEFDFYFLHSYYFVPKDSAHVLAVADYGTKFAASVGVDNIYGVQFHPEKSHQAGIALLKNFADAS